MRLGPCTVKLSRTYTKEGQSNNLSKLPFLPSPGRQNHITFINQMDSDTRNSTRRPYTRAGFRPSQRSPSKLISIQYFAANTSIVSGEAVSRKLPREPTTVNLLYADCTISIEVPPIKTHNHRLCWFYPKKTSQSAGQDETRVHGSTGSAGGASGLGPKR